MIEANDLRHLLVQHTGTTQLFRHPFTSCAYTDGVRAFVDNAGGGAYWLLDIVLTEPAILRNMRSEGIVFVELDVKDGAAVLTCKRDTDGPLYYARPIACTDCPDGVWRFYFSDNVLMVPSEY